MAPADAFSAPGGAYYDSDTMTVGDGTWDFEKNTFLLPNLAGLNFETMRYNGMGNRFSTVAQYHTLILGHGILAAMIFLFFVPTAVLIARFYTGRPGWAVKVHSMMQTTTVLLLTVVFALGWFAVGPRRSWTNPHHAIGLALYVMFLLQLLGGCLVPRKYGRSLRRTIHQWSGRLIALLGIVQVPLGLTLYGSPRYLFILFAVWMALLLLLYFILDYRASDDRRLDRRGRGAHTDAYGAPSEHRTEVTEREKERSGAAKWLGPLAAGGALWAFMRHRNNKKERDESPGRSRSRSRSPGYSRGPEVIPSRRGSESYVDNDKYTEVDSRRDGDNDKRGPIMKGLLGVGAALGAGKLMHSMMNRRRDKRGYNDEYSAVSTETPRRDRVGRFGPEPSEYSDYTVTTRHDPGRGPGLPPPGNAPPMTGAPSAADERRARGPVTPLRSHARSQSGYDMVESDYSSYVSPSRRQDDTQRSGRGGAAQGVLAGLGLGWLAKKWSDRKNDRAGERRMRDEEDQRTGVMGSRFTGDGYSSPSRVPRHSRRRPSARPPPSTLGPSTLGPSTLGTTVTGMTETSSQFEPRPAASGYSSGPPMPPLAAGALPPGPPPGPPPAPGSYMRRTGASGPGYYPAGPVEIPAVPSGSRGAPPHRDSEGESYLSPSGYAQRRQSSRRRRTAERAAAAAAASASLLAAEEEDRRKADAQRSGYSPGRSMSVKVKVHDDKDRNMTLRRLTDEEAATERTQRGRRRNGSTSSLSSIDTLTGRRYRRDGSQRPRAEPPPGAAPYVPAAPSAPPSVHSVLPPLTAGSGPLPPPPDPSAAAGGGQQKDSAYYSGQPPPQTPVGGPEPPPPFNLDSPGSHGTWSGMSPSSGGAARPPTASGEAKRAPSAAADNRRRRRLERRRSTSRPTAVGPDMFD
ncbi:hypothetical protein SODALDRAFT_352820 [Sodiomyces alkalinus F11]|uniref:Cytochrome b561 domain-containing protein n=1 Tax=Sodiomyces alkalinus (strain CBS 110278 / VKM F-3762 / F11) TaxID=1314773 RepID=A0A3N2PNA3_SODAK|nr:hypothetical protein SODALDRAFT_352820 [Sodiomyces alkalinus F11]ROT35969.1 hypothetical protein SODALDRAFT_352820 [Sodiomyces alkalinus F11]